jgi:AcrR family transcriptional regulator
MAAGTAPPRAEGISARMRLLAAADQLFYAEGVQSVGIDRVIELAGVARATLYNTFGSKEALVRAYLDARHAGTVSRLTAAVEHQTDPRARLLAVFESQGELFAEPGFNGCAFVTASAEAASGSQVEAATDDYRAWIRQFFIDLSTAAGVGEPEALATQLQLIYDGAGLSARMDRSPAVAAAARAAAAALLDAALATRPAGSQK